MAFAHYATIKKNLVRQAGITCSTHSVDVDYPLKNLITLPAARPTRLNLTTGFPVKLHLTFPGPVALDLFALIDHNLSSSADIVIRGGTVFDPDGSQFLDAIPVMPRTCYRLLDQPQSLQYWTLEITDVANEYGFIDIGYLFATRSEAFDFGFDWGWTRAMEYENLRKESEFLIPYVRNLAERRRVGIDFSALTEAQTRTIRDLVAEHKRDESPLLFVPDPTRMDALFGRWEADPRERIGPGYYESVSQEFAEDPPHRILIGELPYFAFPHTFPAAATFTRAGTAYGKNADLQLVPYGEDELREYWLRPGVGGWLIEGIGESNLLKYSEDLTNAVWGKAPGVTIAANSADEPVVGPTGLMDGIVENDGVTQNHYVWQNVDITANADVAFAVYLRPGTRDGVRLSIKDRATGQNGVRAYFNVRDGMVDAVQAFGTGSGPRAYIEPMVDGVYRCTIAGNVGGDLTALRCWIYCALADQSLIYEGVGGDPALYVWGAHASQQGWPGSYVPRLTSADASRPADVLKMPYPTPLQGRPFTAYARMVEIGSRYLVGSRHYQIGRSGLNTGSRMYCYYSTDSKLYQFVYRNSVDEQSFTTRTAASVGSAAEIRYLLHPEGATQIGVALDGGAESVSGKGAAIGLEYYGDELRVAANPVGGDAGLLLLQELKFAHGVQTMEHMRRL